ncbi:hypothetical protein HJG60_008798 [Phyllostomus discolor]|uniref:Uncharacterized protein n=1 Tax=Phyllostomus discolor TaxID=89673 RepID=A0A833YWH8_9CHIR|nr:hypothetical protein HJG60_008798 [Phyllostomus discolor]
MAKRRLNAALDSLVPTQALPASFAEQHLQTDAPAGGSEWTGVGARLPEMPAYTNRRHRTEPRHHQPRALCPRLLRESCRFHARAHFITYQRTGRRASVEREEVLTTRNLTQARNSETQALASAGRRSDFGAELYSVWIRAACHGQASAQ